MFTAGAPQGWPEKKCRFAEALGCTKTHLLWKCKAFGVSSLPQKGKYNTKQRDVSILVTAGEEGGLLRQRDQKGTFSDYIKF
jgi:hypothetical protein